MSYFSNLCSSICLVDGKCHRPIIPFFPSRRMVFFSVDCIVGMFHFLCNIMPKSFAWSTFSNHLFFFWYFCSFRMFVFQFFNESNLFVGSNFFGYVCVLVFIYMKLKPMFAFAFQLSSPLKKRLQTRFFRFSFMKQNMNGKHEWTTQINHLILGRATKKKSVFFSLKFSEKDQLNAKSNNFFLFKR